MAFRADQAIRPVFKTITINMGFFHWCALAVPFCMAMPAFSLASAVEGEAMRTKVLRQAPDDAGYLLGAVSLPSAYDQLEHFIAGKKMQFGIEYGAGQGQYAFSFSDKMALSDRSDLLACLQGQTELMRELHKNMLKQ